jgi:hypothetical protein
VSNESAVTVEDRIERVHTLDLEPIVVKLMHPEPGETVMSLEEADRLVGLYRQYLILCLRYPDVGIVPTKEIDQVWHTHILDTAKYQQDCDEVFGFFLHHFPYLGLRGEEDEHQWHAQYARTCELFKREFGVPLVPHAMFSCGPGQHSSMPGACIEGAECEHFTREDLIARERPRPVRASSSS